jgi:hypothetical protein
VLLAAHAGACGAGPSARRHRRVDNLMSDGTSYVRPDISFGDDGHSATMDIRRQWSVSVSATGSRELKNSLWASSIHEFHSLKTKFQNP